MTRLSACVALISLWLADGCSCARDHTIPVDAWRVDGGPGTECVGGSVGEMTFAVSCASGVANCAHYWQGIAPDGERALSIECQDYLCTAADTCIDTPEGRRCHCGDNWGCPGPCVRTSDGSAHCVAPCLREVTPARSCAPISLRVPAVGLHLFSGRCDADAAHACRLWAQSIAPPGTHALADCAQHQATLFCVLGDACASEGDAGPVACTCHGSTCGPTEVCVSNETGDTTPHCVEACWAIPDP